MKLLWGLRWLSLALIAMTLAGCATSTTGRSQLTLMPTSVLDNMGAQNFAQLKQEQQLWDNAPVQAYVRCISDALIRQDPEHLGRPSDWEVQVFSADQVNAFALPGRKIGVYRGLFAHASTPDRLAAVVGHEIAHVINHHANERLSQNLLVSGGLLATGIALEASDNPNQKLIMAALGIGAQVGVLLPYSRLHESEADEVGLELMARAGFNPQAAVELWRSMSGAGGQSSPEWLSTHPSHQTRIERLERLAPDLARIYSSRRSPECPVPTVLQER